MHRNLWVSVGVALVFAGCAHGERRTEPGMTREWTSIAIADGAANGFRFEHAAGGRVQFVYKPVTPEQSSSGLYSGGAPRTEDLAGDDARLAELWAMLRSLEADEKLHTPDRAKGTGAITWESPGGRHVFIIKMGSELNVLLALLARFGS